jgi:hypothetical protein
MPCWVDLVGTIIGGGWGGYYPGPIVVQPLPIGGDTTIVNVNQTTPAVTPNAIPEAVAQAFDLELLDLRFVDDGLAADQGPRYRLTVRNRSRSDVTGSISVALVASFETKPDQAAMHAVAKFEALAAGAMQAVDVRLPAQAAQQTPAFRFLTAAVALSDGAVDANPADNGATFDRSAVRDVDLRLDTVRMESGRLVLVGEGFGRDAGELTLMLGTTPHAVLAGTWNATEVGFNLPAFDPQGADHGELQLTKLDGRVGPPLEIRFAAK